MVQINNRCFIGNLKLMWDRCFICKRPMWSSLNVIKLSGIIFGCVYVGFTLGSKSLARIGFGAGGIIAGTFAAAWHSGIGNAAAGTLFAALQSLGASGLGIYLFGIPGALLAALVPYGFRIKWCEQPYSKECFSYNL